MIAEGLFDRFPCYEIYALHNVPGLAVGTIGVPVGAAMASADAIDLILHADGTDASAPHTGADGVMAACAFIRSLQQVSTRVIDARRAGVVSIGVIQGYDLVWFGVIVVVATEIAMITPPIGMNVYF